MISIRRVLRAATVPLALVVMLLAAVVTACGGDAVEPGGGGTPVAEATSGGTPVATATSSGTPVAETSTDDADAGFPLTIVDSDGHELTIERRPTRIISYSPGATESLFAIGAGEQMLATDEYSNYPAETALLERVRYSDPDPERALDLAPDLVILAGRQELQVEQFRRLGLPVIFAREPGSIEGVFDAIQLLGRATGRDEEAASLVSEMQRRIGVVATRIADIDRGPTVFYELTDDLYTAAPDTFIGGMLRLLRAENIASGATSPFPQLTAEAVLAADPQVVLLADGEWVSVDSVAERPGWAGVAAVASGRIYAVDPDLGNRPGPRIVDAIEEMARAIYPERFPEGATAAAP